MKLSQIKERQKWRDREIMRDKIDTKGGNQGRGGKKKTQKIEKKEKSGYFEYFHFFLMCNLMF